MGRVMISSTMLKMALTAWLPFMTNTINFSLSTGVFLITRKQVSILKIKQSQTFSDTYPIAQLFKFSKLLEKVVHQQFFNC